MSRVIVHRCPRCKSKSIGKTKRQEKSDVQKGLELVGGFLEGYFIGTNGSITEYISNSINDPSKMPKYYCKDCGNTWNHENYIDETPIEVLEEEKKNLISSLKTDCILKVFGLIVVGAVTVWSFLYCWNNNFKTYHTEDLWLLGETQITDWHYDWLLVGIVFVITLILTIKVIGSLLTDIDKISRLRKMSADSYRHYNIF